MNARHPIGERRFREFGIEDTDVFPGLEIVADRPVLDDDIALAVLGVAADLPRAAFAPAPRARRCRVPD